MKVLIAAGIFPPEPGGPATYAKIMSEELPKRGIDVDVLPFRDVRHLPPIVRHIAYAVRVWRRGRSADVVYAQDTMSAGWPAYFANILLRKRFAVRVPGDHVWEQGVQRFRIQGTLDTFPVFSWRWHPYLMLLRVLQRAVVRGADRVIVPSEYLKRVILEWGVSPEKIRVVYSAFVDGAIVEDGKEELRALLDLPTPTIISAGRLVPWKGMRMLIDIMPELISSFPDIALLIVSDGPERSSLEARAQELALGQHVRFMGTLPHDALFRYIKAADAFVLNTGYEGLSYHLLEVMSIGTPIITTNVGGNPELIENAKEGILVRYNNAAELLAAVGGVLRGSIKGEELARAAQEKVRRFSTGNMVEGTVRALSV